MRVHGGALPTSGAAGSFAERAATDEAAKRALAAGLAALIPNGGVVIIDGGTINLAVAAALPPDTAATFVVTSPRTALALARLERSQVLLLGGRLDPRLECVTGARPVQALREIEADLCLLGACAVHAELGLACFDPEDAALKQAMIAAAGETALGVTSAKLGARAPFVVAGIDRLAHLVAEPTADAATLERLAAAGVTVHLTGPPIP